MFRTQMVQHPVLSFRKFLVHSLTILFLHTIYPLQMEGAVLMVKSEVYRKKQFWPKAKYYFSIQMNVLRKIWSRSKNLGQRKYNLCLYTQVVVQSVCRESCLNTACTCVCVCVCYYRNITSQQYRPTPPYINKIHSVQTVSLTQENKCKKFTFWSQLAQ